MSQFDVYKTDEGDMLLDCQSEALANLTTRLVAPLLPVADAPEARARLNPRFEINGEGYVMVTQFAATVDQRLLRTRVADVADDRLAVIGAFDMLLTGV